LRILENFKVQITLERELNHENSQISRENLKVEQEIGTDLLLRRAKLCQLKKIRRGFFRKVAKLGIDFLGLVGGYLLNLFGSLEIVRLVKFLTQISCFSSTNVNPSN
jgi:hypothetical protein